ncbi:PMT family glycosyltransferase, 4-amino-4-deoxy-L-arabinose transferase [Mycobacterium sp. JS623]|uniref:ArnT family glycosyltransferase n=1 Tax=Mycobacterium sp. JS623 TaxID=212767 RepID=UPI0002A5B115|nr:PMT family glycosyltransferase, 4-amino-4-deoxy-L-arabinose transferase [Mycobacterium sp. JS623]
MSSPPLLDGPETQAPPADDADRPRPTRATAITWDRVGLAVLLVGTAVIYLWNITINGMGNQFYAAAAQAGSKNWEALLFGSLDPHNFITVDKPPVSQWVMGLSGQIFGFSSASMMIPQALMAVASVALLYAAVTRISGPRVGLLAGAVLALTPVAALMFRFNNPDAVMVLLMTAAAYCTVRAVQQASPKWLAWAAVALGFAFLAKMLEGLMVAPALAAAYLIAAPTTLRARLRHIGVAAVAFVMSAGWFVVLTLLWPASSRPYIAGSTDNNFMNLVLGYNGFARVLGKNHMDFGTPDNVVGTSAGAQLHNGGHGGFAFGNQSQGLPRLVSGEFGFEIGWLVPAALLATVMVVLSRGRAPRTDLTRAAAIVFGGWLIVDGLVLSFMHGTIHAYYCLSIAPPVAAMFAIGVHELWQRREKWLYRAGLAVLLGGTGAWAWVVLGRNASWLPALRWTILALAVLAVVALLVPWTYRADRRFAFGALGIGLVAALAGPAVYAVVTIGQPHEGGGPSVGPADASRQGHFGFGQNKDNPALDTMLKNTNTEWSAAISRSSSAAGLELSTDTAVMAIGGFSGTDPVPTLSEFKTDVAQHKVAYYVVVNDHGHGPGWGNSRGHADIAKWVAATFESTSVGDATVYDLSTPK